MESATTNDIHSIESDEDDDVVFLKEIPGVRRKRLPTNFYKPRADTKKPRNKTTKSPSSPKSPKPKKPRNSLKKSKQKSTRENTEHTPNPTATPAIFRDYPCRRSIDGEYDGCQNFEPSDADTNCCDVCGCGKEYHMLGQESAPINSLPLSHPSTPLDSPPLASSTPSSTASSPLFRTPSQENSSSHRTSMEANSLKDKDSENEEEEEDDDDEEETLLSKALPSQKEVLQEKQSNHEVEDLDDVQMDVELVGDEAEVQQKIEHYPHFPSCPSKLEPQLKKLNYRQRVVLENLVSHGHIQWKQLNSEFVKRLVASSTSMSNYLQVVGDLIPKKKSMLHIFNRFIDEENGELQKRQQILCLNATVTKQRITFDGPFLEKSNRVLRYYGADRFLRVNFIVKTPKQEKSHESLRKVFRTVLKNGIKYGGRNFVFLSFSASQLRDHKCYFFATSGDDIPPDKEITTEAIKAWMGDFSEVRAKSISKFCARLGQPFSKTIPTVFVPPEDIIEVDDIRNVKYIFTDGCGEISPEYAEKVSKALNLNYVPSAFQIRFGEYKGVLAVNSELHNKVLFRKSMKKFTIQNPTESQRTIEVIKCATGRGGYLNRQFIIQLSSLGVPTEVFLQLQEAAVNEIMNMKNSGLKAIERLQNDDTDASDLAMKAKVMLMAGHSIDEPHLQAIILSLQKQQLLSLKEKAKIFVPNSKLLMGVYDQSGQLESGQVFVKYSVGTNMTHILNTTIAVSKNPCVHPGDFRLLQAVDIPALHHLVDVIVFPVKGDRPHPSEIGGGDLDGDLYFITWDTGLIKFKPVEPAAYAASDVLKPFPSDRDELEVIHNYFVESLFSQTLGYLSNLHEALCARIGTSMDDGCIQLAELISRAIDAPKTGDVVTAPQWAIDFVKKEWPHYMEKQPSFVCKTAVGQLYDKCVEHLNKLSGHKQTITLDSQLLRPGRTRFESEARKLHKSYNQEVSEAMKLADDEHKSIALQGIFQKYRAKFLEKGKGKIRAETYDDFLDKASAWYEVAYTKAQTTENIWGTDALSFPWNTCMDRLNRIKADTCGGDGLAVSVADFRLSHFKFK